MMQRVLAVFGFIIAFAAAQPVNGQSCACPATCSPCAIGIKAITLQLQRDGRSHILIKEGPRTAFDEDVNSGDLISLSGSLPNGRFQGNHLDIYVDGKFETRIDLVCKPTLAVNEVFGDFVIVAATNVNGSALCCKAGGRDRIAPQFIKFPDDISVSTDPGLCGARVSWPKPEAVDCNLREIDVEENSGSFFSIGRTSVRVRARDYEGNRSTRYFNITVSDSQKPVFISCPLDINITIGSGTGSVVRWDLPQVVDNCIIFTVTSNFRPGDTFPVGQRVVTYTATDMFGNSSTCSFKVKVSVEGQQNPPDEENPPGGEPPIDEPGPPSTGPGEEPLDIDISRVVTPDGDGTNDVWIIKNIERYENSVLVTDRWGGVVFSANNYDNETVVWDGKVKGASAPMGTYFFAVTYTKAEKYFKTSGFIELIP